MTTYRLVSAALGAALMACTSTPEPITALSPDPNPMDARDPMFTPQPHRDRPRAICTSLDGSKAWVMLAGVEDSAGSDVVVVDLDAQVVVGRITLGRSPWSCALDPNGRHLVVTLRYSDHAIVLDADRDEEVARLPVPFYTEGVIWSPDGSRLFFANRWKDSVFFIDVDPASSDFRVIDRSDRAMSIDGPIGTSVGDNPGPMVFSSDARRLFVGLVAGGAISVLDASSGAAIDVDDDPNTTSLGAAPGVSRIELLSPVGGLAVHGDHLFVSDIGPGVGSEPAHGLDLDDDGQPGDGTANVIFQDLQNEIGVIDTRTLVEVQRYTSDTICCRDFRDVDPDRPERGLLLPMPDTWAPDVIEHLTPKASWIVAGALPEAMIVRGDVLWVAFAGSNEVQSFDIDAGGGLSARQTKGGLYGTGHNPKAIAATPSAIITVDRLAESLTVFSPDEPPGAERRLVVGDVSAGPFPASDAEIGEAINEMTAAFTIDGDQTCVHCHRDNGATARPVVMPLQVIRAWGARNVLAQRGLYDSRPWFFESAMDETNFFPVLNEFNRKENFCCERLDPTVWSRYPSLDDCSVDPNVAGCNHVLRCESDPPPECGDRPYADTGFLRRGVFMRAAAMRLFGRDTGFGDTLFDEGPSGEREPKTLDFDGVTRALGLFMLRTPRLLPNPNRPLATASAERGRRIFEQAATGCSLCHPLPRGTTASRPERFSPSAMPIRFPPVVSPSRSPDGRDASRVTSGFVGTFPETVQGPAGLHLGATVLRGIWDRPSTRFLHDGRARSLREVLSIPEHPALQPGEVGRNERDGVFDTHGGTSHLDRYELQDLINFVLTL